MTRRIHRQQKHGLCQQRTYSVFTEKCMYVYAHTHTQRNLKVIHTSACSSTLPRVPWRKLWSIPFWTLQCGGLCGESSCIFPRILQGIKYLHIFLKLWCGSSENEVDWGLLTESYRNRPQRGIKGFQYNKWRMSHNWLTQGRHYSGWKNWSLEEMWRPCKMFLKKSHLWSIHA